MVQKEPYGIGGWLALLIFTLTLLWPLGMAASIASQLTGAEQHYAVLANSQHWHTYKLFYTVTVVGAMILSVFCGIKLADERRPETVALTKLTLWLIFPGVNMAVSVVYPILLMPDAPFVHWVESLSGVVGAMIPAYAGTRYLARSTRVRNTYGLRHEDC